MERKPKTVIISKCCCFKHIRYSQVGSYLKKQKIYFVRSVIMLRDCITNLKGSFKKKNSQGSQPLNDKIYWQTNQCSWGLDRKWVPFLIISENMFPIFLFVTIQANIHKILCTSLEPFLISLYIFFKGARLSSDFYCGLRFSEGL